MNRLSRLPYRALPIVFALLLTQVAFTPHGRAAPDHAHRGLVNSVDVTHHRIVINGIRFRLGASCIYTGAALREPADLTPGMSVGYRIDSSTGKNETPTIIFIKSIPS